MTNMDARVQEAVRHFWMVRNKQSVSQGAKSGSRDAGSRKDVTGGKHLDGFVALIRDLLKENGVAHPDIFANKKKVEIPGWFRAEKQWDLLIVSKGKLIAALELKSMGDSFGNNYNNRTEETIGNATDLLAAYREGAFAGSLRPWIGYLMLLSDEPATQRPVSVRQPHYDVFPEFKGASYVKRYEITLTKLVRERLYDAACLITSDKVGGLDGKYSEPVAELSFNNFSESLLARAIAHARTSPTK